MDVRAARHKPAGTRHSPARRLLESSARPAPAGHVEDRIAPVLARRGAHPVRPNALDTRGGIDPCRVLHVRDLPLGLVVHEHPPGQPSISAPDPIPVTRGESERLVLFAGAVEGLHSAAHLVAARACLVDDVVKHHLLHRHRPPLGVHHAGLHAHDVPVEPRRSHLPRVPRRVAHLVGLERERSLPDHDAPGFGFGLGNGGQEEDEQGR